MSTDVKLRTNGKEYGGWKTTRVTRGIETVSGSFELDVSDRWGNQSKPWPIFEEDECTLLIGSTTLITGFVDKRSVSYDANEHTLSVSGRDATGALVDCSAELQKWEFKNTPVLTLAKRICEPYSIPVTLASGVVLPTAPAKISVDPGDTGAEVIERACRSAGLLAVSDGLGGLLLTRSGTARTATELVEGENILAASAEFDASSRYRTYAVLGQHKGTDEFSGEQAATIKATASDENVTRSSRTLIIRPEGNVTAEQAKRRAEWEACVRAGRADSVSVTVQGWTQSNGEVWPINTKVRLRSPLLGIDGDLLITQATYTIGDDGTKTQLTLKRVDSFIPETVITTATTAYWKEIVRGV